ncbi:MAG: PEFG-CTERM sorting domain-containing protein [Thaumarchaeota archaeon]|nr:MAG: PEFG-CTERM sorting domain-containing protein [Nitrososphaerota archaeon]
MVLSDNNVYVVWQDGAPNQHEILFAKSTTFVPEFGTLASLVLLVAILFTTILFAKTIPRLKMNSVL